MIPSNRLVTSFLIIWDCQVSGSNPPLGVGEGWCVGRLGKACHANINYTLNIPFKCSSEVSSWLWLSICIDQLENVQSIPCQISYISSFVLVPVLGIYSWVARVGACHTNNMDARSDCIPYKKPGLKLEIWFCFKRFYLWSISRTVPVFLRENEGATLPLG